MRISKWNEIIKRSIAGLLSFVMLFGMLPDLPHVHAVEEGNDLLAGKTISILGASISTYAGTSNGTAAETTNSTIANNVKYYPHSVVSDVTLNDTWWMQVVNDLGLRLLVNNSWSGSSLLYERNGTVGAYVDRCVQLHDDTGENAGETPDIIGIQMGTNDFQYYKDTLGTADIDYDTLITENTDGTYTYAVPVTSLEAAAIVLHKISVRYPNAEVYYLNISQRVDGTDELIRSFNAELKQVVEHFGAHIVDIYGSAITTENFDTYIGDGRVHPNKLGMDAYAEAFKRTLIANTSYTVDTHTVSLALDGVSASYGDDKIVVSGDSYSVDLTAADALQVTVTMGGQDITDSAYADGTVTINAVTDNVTITAKSVYAPKDYRWDFDGTDLACVSGDNALIKNAGTTTDGVFSNTRYALDTAVRLMHDQPWVVEWKCEGTFKNSGSSSGARVFTSTDVNAENNARYIFKSNNDGIIAMGEKTTSGSHNYGLALADYGIDWTELHTYRLENRIASDGSNMVWLYVDGKEIGPLNNYYVGTTNKNTTSDWLSGKDFVFPYMGTDTHGFSNCSIEYIQVWENHVHAYTGTITAPTCTEQGYTTYTCACGDSYVADYVEAGHTYEFTVCTRCGDSNVVWEQGTILAASGLEKDYPIVIRTADYLRVCDYVGMTLNAEHYLTYFVYDADFHYLGNGKADLTANFLLSGQGISTHEMLIHYPEGEYFRIALWRGEDNEMTPDMLEGADVVFLDSHRDPVFWEMGSIYAASGIAFVREQVIRSVNYLPVEDYAGVTVADGYAISFLAYDEELNYLGNGNPAKTGYFIPGRVTMQEILDQYPDTKYVRLLLVEDPIADFTMEAVKKSGIRVYQAGETVPEKTYSYQGRQDSFDLKYACGLLDAENGTYSCSGFGFVTTKCIPLDQISKITWAEEYALLWCAYDAQMGYLGSSKEYLSNGEIAKSEILTAYADACYIVLSVKNKAQQPLELADMIRSSGLAVHSDLSHTERIAHDTVMNAQKSQDGAIYRDTLFLFNSAGTCTVFDIAGKTKLGSFTLDKVSVLKPHANSVCFSDVFYAEDDPFPLLYVNIYNNYWTTNDRKEGTCCVYRIYEENGKYSTKLVQVLKIGFADDYDLWNSDEGNGYDYYLPYGNFVVDTDEDKLWVFVLRNGEEQTRFFKFDLPMLSDGVYNETYGCNLVTLDASDIEDMFDVEHFEIIQGCTYADGKIYSANGLGSSASSSAFAELKVIDLQSKAVVSVVDFSTLGFSLEPEMISFNDLGDGQLYYLCIDGTLRRLRFVEEPLQDALYRGEALTHGYTVCVTAPTCTEQGYTTHSCACGNSYTDIFTDALGHSWDDGVCTVCGAEKKPYQRLTYFTVDVVGDNGKIYTDNAVLYLPADYSPDGEPVKLVICCKQGASQITPTSNPIEAVGFYNYLISLGYAVLGVDGVPDAWRDELGLGERAVGNPMAVQGTQRAYDYVVDNYNIASDGCFISGYSQGGHYAQNVIDLTDIPILAAAEQSPVCSMRYHQWDLNANQTVGGVKFTKAARLNVARIYGFPEFTTNTELLNLAYDASLVDAYDPWVRNSGNVYTGFVQKSNLWYLPEGTSLEDITMTKNAKCPVKIWCAEDDTAISADVMKVFVKAIQNAGGTAEISVAASGGHGFFQSQTPVGTFTENGKTYNTLPIAVEIARWFEQYSGYASCKHAYSNGVCTVCGAEHPNLANYEGKVISILGDSISTFAGYIPVEDGFNLEHKSFYPNSAITSVDQTWWMQVITGMDAKLGVNESWSGSRVLNTLTGNSGNLGKDAAMASLTRIRNLGSNGTPDVIFFFGGTNDIAFGSPLGSFDPETAPTQVDLTSVQWETYADAYVAAIMRMQHFYPDARIVAVFPTINKSYYTDETLARYCGVMQAICERYGVAYTDLAGSGFTGDMLADVTHPNATGMTYIANTVTDTLLDSHAVTEGENVVYSVTHNLTDVTASLGYYKGVSHGASFAETLSAENGVTVTVTMGGVDVTNEVYSDGTVTVSQVTGDLIITARENASKASDYEGKVISILGDSISTFAGYIPVADGFNLTHLARYPQDNLLTDVNETWWMQVVTQLDAKLGINDSWRGSTVSGYPSVTTGVAGYLAAMSNLTQLQNLGSNGTPDVILFYGGTNDLAHTPKLGSFDPATAPSQVDLTTLKWDNLADAYANILLRLQYFYPDAQIVCLLPTYTKSYYTNDKLAQGNALMASICEHYGVTYVDLRYCGISTADLPDGIHPDATGMDYITAAVLDTLFTQCEMDAGEHTVYTVTHALENAEASLGYYKGISAGKPFVETLTADGELTVTVTMDGVDITDQVYADGTVNIPAVTGNLSITATARFTLGDRLQQLPDPYYGVNLWPILEHDEDYFYIDEWTVHSSGNVRSVTIPVLPGEKLYASSFEAGGTNGSSVNGIRITFFSADGVLISMGPDAVYVEFAEKGYVTVPENAAAVNIPMWTNSNAWELYIYDSAYAPSNGLEAHLQQLPDNICGGVNLWDLLTPEDVYYTGSDWGDNAGGKANSVTIPVSAGDRIWATAFQAKNANGSGSVDGIRVTFFGEQGVIQSKTPAQVYEEFSNKGYITAPEGAIAVNIPMWKGNADIELYILTLEHSYGDWYETKVPTCDADGEEYRECISCEAYETRTVTCPHAPEYSWDVDGDGVLEILAIGNSFSVDALQYAYQIAQDLGVENIVIGNLYIGGCTLETHATNAAGDLAKYTYYYNDSGTWTTTKNYKISTALESRSWDYISMQQASKNSGVESTYNEDLTDLIAYVKDLTSSASNENRNPCAKLVWHMTWAYQQNSTHSAFPTYGSNQMTMYNAIVSAAQNKIVTNSNFDLIVPNGTAVQNSRTSLLGDTTTRDGYHMSKGYGCYLTGLMFIKTVTGLSVDGITYAPSGVDAQEMAIAIESVNSAYAQPFGVTQSNYVEKEPELPEGFPEGYILLAPELYKGAFWHSTYAQGFNVLHRDKSNSHQYFATLRFTKDELPVGSVIILEEGWQYRPEAWVTDTLQTSREDITSERIVEVTEEWWGDYTIRGFNISKVGLPSLSNVTEEEVRAAFRIYVPEELHNHSYVPAVTDPTCTEAGYTTYTCSLCADSYTGDSTEATGHTPGEAVKENETADGVYDSVVYCSVCGEELSRETIKTHTPGDINGDGNVDNKDLTRLFRYLSGYDVTVVEAALDVNGDGSVNNKDQTRLFRYLSGWDVEIY